MDQVQALDKLMRATVSNLEFVVRGKTVKLSMRTLGAVDDQYRQDYSVSRSRRILARLRNPESQEYGMYLGTLEHESRDDLIERAVNLKRPRIFRDIRLEVHPDDTDEAPDNPTITEIVEAEESRLTAEESVMETIASEAKGRVDEYRETLQEMDDIDLAEEAKNLMIDSIVAMEFNRASNDATLACSVYTDSGFKARYFASPEEASNSDPELYGRLIAEYSRLDGFSLEPEQLKN